MIDLELLAQASILGLRVIFTMAGIVAIFFVVFVATFWVAENMSDSQLRWVGLIAFLLFVFSLVTCGEYMRLAS
jgi:hypothetical protein